MTSAGIGKAPGPRQDLDLILVMAVAGLALDVADLYESVRGHIPPFPDDGDEHLFCSAGENPWDHLEKREFILSVGQLALKSAFSDRHGLFGSLPQAACT